MKEEVLAFQPHIWTLKFSYLTGLLRDRKENHLLLWLPKSPPHPCARHSSFSSRDGADQSPVWVDTDEKRREVVWGRGSTRGAPCCCVATGSPSFLQPLHSCSLPGGFPVHQAGLMPTSTSPDLAVAPGKSTDGTLSTGMAEVSPRGSTWGGGLPVPAGSAHLAAEPLGDPHVVSFQPRPHHPIPEAPLWACPISSAPHSAW